MSYIRWIFSEQNGFTRDFQYHNYTYKPVVFFGINGTENRFSPAGCYKIEFYEHVILSVREKKPPVTSFTLKRTTISQINIHTIQSVFVEPLLTLTIQSEPFSIILRRSHYQRGTVQIHCMKRLFVGSSHKTNYLIIAEYVMGQYYSDTLLFYFF